MTFLFTLAARLVGERFAKPLTYAAIIAAILLIAALVVRSHDKRVIADHDSAITEKTLTIDTAAKEAASNERARDVIAIDKASKDRTDAIEKAADGKPSDSAVALGCERLRRAGTDTSGIAACSGSNH